jgi:hypothetical protein
MRYLIFKIKILKKDNIKNINIYIINHFILIKNLNINLKNFL